jgi:ribonucleoside-diphosphate reductase alpha chain
MGPQTAYADRLHSEKYRLKGETFRDAMNRVASSLCDSDVHYHALREILLAQRFLPAGRIQAAMGSPKAVTPYNCYVSGNIPDSFVARDNPENSSIMHRAEQAAQTMRMGGGIGYNFSSLRPLNAPIKKLGSRSGGPLSFMPIFDKVCGATSSAGNRRGAQMGVMNIDHPDILSFIHAKHNQDALTGFNISIGVTDEFMEAKAAGKPFDLRFGGEVYDTVDARELWETVMRSTWDWAEPGVLFLDRVNQMNNLWYCETILATNPCGEQPLPPFGACLLGSFNLVAYLRFDLGGYWLDLEQLEADIPHIVRAMDNVVDRAKYPLPEQEAEAKNKRRMGLGVTGLANALEATGHPYGNAGFLRVEDRVLQTLTRGCYLASVNLAKEKGPFPLFDKEKYLQGKFVQTLDEDVLDLIGRYGIRNSHLTSIAPTGTISLAADNISSSIEPVYRWAQERTIIMDNGSETVPLYDYGFANLRVRGRRTSMGEVTAQQHVDVLVTAQKHIDSAVSKTVNCDSDMPWADFKAIYDQAYEGGAKGCTTFNKGGKRMGLFKETPEPADLAMPNGMDRLAAGASVDTGLSCEFDPATGRRSCE